MSQLAEIVSAQQRLEESFAKKMGELEAQLQSAGPAKDTVAKIAEEFRTFRELMFSMLGILRKQIQECSRQIDVMETRQRRKALIFLGVTESDKENSKSVVLDILHSKMALKNIAESSIKVCHRLGAPTKERQRPILVRFSTVDEKNAVWRTKSMLKSSSFTVKEFLTKPRQAAFSKARTHFGMRSCWTQDGLVMLKDPDGRRHKITSVEELDPLIIKFPKGTGQSSSGAKLKHKTLD